MEYKNILVTGGSGFIGGHLTESLLARGYRVTIIDRHPPTNPKVAFHQIDFTKVEELEPILKKHDAVFHLAAMVGVDRCRLHPEEVMRINYEETKRFINVCLKSKIKHFFFTSSSEVYGNSKEIPYKEDAKLQPVSVYGQTKILTEQYLHATYKNHQIPISIVRLFNVYGPGQKPTFVVPIFVNLAREGRNITIIGDGKQIRCFTYVKDATEGMVRLFEKNDHGYEIINIGNKQEYTVRQVADTVLKVLPYSRSSIKYLPYGQNGVREKELEIERRVPSVERAKKLLNFEATTSLEEGIRFMIEAS